MTPNRSNVLKRVLLAAVGLLHPATGEAAEPAPKSIVDYYRQVPEALFPNQHKGELTRTKKGWITHSTQTDEELPVTVDIQNGFIEFVDEGTGGGTGTLQAALFLKENKSSLFGINESSSDGVTAEGKLVFIARDGGHFKDVTAEVLPKLRVEDFIDARCMALLQKSYRDSVGPKEILFKLPRQGTTIQARVPLFSHFFVEGTPEKDAQSCMSAGARELPWDAKAGKFSLAPAPKGGGSAGKAP